MNRKKAFTLLELMVTLSIFLILSVMVSSILIQGQRILAKVNSGSIIQDEVRTALLKIQTEAQNSDEVIINNKFGSFDENKWIVNGVGSSARELVRFINNEEENAKVYVEVNENNEHQLIEFSINKSTNEIIDNNKNVLISRIEGNNANTVTLDVEEISDSKGNKINELVTINCSNVINGNNLNDSDYLITFTRGRENVININVGSNESEELGRELEFESVVTGKWNNEGEWKINLTNNTENDIKAWSITIKSNINITVWDGWGKVDKIEGGLYKLYNEENSWKAPIKSGETIEIKGNYSGGTELIMSMIKYEYNHK